MKSSVHNITRDTYNEEAITDDNYGNEDIDNEEGNIDNNDNRDIVNDDNRNDNVDDDVVFVAEYNGAVSTCMNILTESPCAVCFCSLFVRRMNR